MLWQKIENKKVSLIHDVFKIKEKVEVACRDACVAFQNLLGTSSLVNHPV